jgi:hypothetical protein
MRRPLRPLFSAALCAAFFVQTTGAADFGPALMRGAIMPPPGVLAPMGLRPGAAGLPPSKAALPKPAKPAGEPWLTSAMAVSRWVNNEGLPALGREASYFMKGLRGAPSVEAAVEPEALPMAPEVTAAMPPGDPSRDRMLISMEGRRVLASGLAVQIASLLQYRTELKPLRARFESEWVGAGALRARVDYMSPFGVTVGEAKGYRVTLADGYSKLLPSKQAVPEGLRREVPLYFAGDEVEVEVAIENTGKTALTGMRLVSVQEDYDPAGLAGAPITAPVERLLPDLAPGARTVARWKIALSSTGRNAVNFEQTHLRVLGKDPAGGEKVILDKAQAGIVDPPSAD